MPKTGTSIEIGEYELEVFVEETKKQYGFLLPYTGNDVGANFFRYLLPRAGKEALDFLKSLGIDPEKLYLARPLTEPDEKGDVLFLCSARLCARVLRGGEKVPRQSVEKAGLSMVFVSDRRSFQTGLDPFPEPQTEIRFVIPLPFDPNFFKQR